MRGVTVGKREATQGKKGRAWSWSSDCDFGELCHCACQRQTTNHCEAISQSVSGWGVRVKRHVRPSVPIKTTHVSVEKIVGI